MKASIVSLAKIEKVGRWRVEVFLDEKKRFVSKWNTRPLDTICDEVSEATDPLSVQSETFTYIGLENVESVTGDAVGDIQKKRGEIRSRSKTFKRGDVLYGRLRPNLRKVFAATETEGGLCSTEFVVLRPKKGVISSTVLRAILAASSVSSQLMSLQIGAALPRVASRDLLAVKVPVPADDVQRDLEAVLENLTDKRRSAKETLANAVSEFESAVTRALI